MQNIGKIVQKQILFWKLKQQRYFEISVAPGELSVAL
jgi:hypothetical protein